MTRIHFVIVSLLMVRCVASSQDLVIKEYLNGQPARTPRIVIVKDGQKTEQEYERFSNIWKYENKQIYHIQDSSVIILNDKFEKIDSIEFEQNVVDLAVKNNRLVVSISNDEVEYYTGKVILVDLETKQQVELPFDELGGHFGLAFSGNANLLSYVHQDEKSEIQTLMIYDFQGGGYYVVEERLLNEGRLGTINYPTTNYWVGEHLYYLRTSNDLSTRSIQRFAVTSGRSETIKQMTDDSYALPFKVTMDEKKLIFLKRMPYRVRQVVAVSIHSDAETVIYDATPNELRATDEFVWIR